MTDIASAIAAEIMGREEIRGNLSEGQTDRLHGAIQEIVERHLAPPAAVAITSPMLPPVQWPLPDEIEAGALGDTCPLLKIARHYGVDYGDALAIATSYTHNRRLLGGTISVEGWSRELSGDIWAYTQRFKRLDLGGGK